MINQYVSHLRILYISIDLYTSRYNFPYSLKNFKCKLETLAFLVKISGIEWVFDSGRAIRTLNSKIDISKSIRNNRL